MDPPRRWLMAPSVGSLIGLCVLAVVVCSGLLLFFRFTQVSHEDARRNRCSLHLAQLGFALHRYHARNHELPPAATAADGPTWALFLWPYCEDVTAGQTTDASAQRIEVFERYDFSQDALAAGNAKVVAELRWQGWFCPTRRRALRTVTVDGLAAQPSDYACVGPTNGADPFSAKSNAVLIAAEFARSGKSSKAASSPTTLADVIDGLSETAAIGEKHIVTDGLWNPATKVSGGDGPITLGRPMYFQRLMGVVAGRSLATGPGDTRADSMFGSWHPGVCQFLMGDVAVRAINNHVDDRVLSLLGSRNDSRNAAKPSP